MYLKRWISIVAIGIIAPFLFTQCSDDDSDSTEKGTVNVKMTDAPIDNANVEGAFVTITEVKIDGQAVEGFEKQTIDLTAYQQGDAKLMASDQMEVGAYENVSFVLDYEQDVSGNTPGCYIMTEDDVKHTLQAQSQSQSEMMINDGFDVESATDNNLVIDFDLRKSIKGENESHGQSDFAFVTHSEMENSFRAVKESNCGTVEGNASNQSSTEGEMVVYAYKKGEFDSESETQGQGQSNMMFANAVTSAKVKSDGSYTLAFLEEGEYEIHVANYEENNQGNMEFQGMVEASSNTSGFLLGGFMVESNASIQLNLTLTGIIGG